MKKIRGFTIIELIVVMAILAALAAILVPLLFAYVSNARISKLNTNARHVYGSVLYAATDYQAGNINIDLKPSSIYVGGADCIGHSNNGDVCDLKNYFGDDFNGYFAFETDSSGVGCLYALWSDRQIPISSVERLSEQDVKDSVSSSLPMGCYPHKVDDDT